MKIPQTSEPQYCAKLCPVCHRQVWPTLKQYIGSHFDSIRSGVCPGSGEEYRLTVISRPEFQGVAS